MADFWFWNFPKSQLFTTIPEPTTSFEGETIVVVGSNSGVGLEAARHIARLGASKLILACRDIAKGEAAVTDIATSLDGKVAKDSLEVWQLDVSSYKSIETFAKRLQGLDRLDAVIQNAGVIFPAFVRLEESGEEACLTTNVTGSILFGLSVLPRLRESARHTGSRGRLAFVGSDLHCTAKLKEVEAAEPLYESLNDPKRTNIADRYAATKRLLLMATREMASRSPVSQDSNVIITCVSPGFCYSNLGRNTPNSVQTMMKAFKAVFARSAEVGGRTLVHSVKPDLEVEAHGRFLVDCKVIAEGPTIESEEGHALQERFTNELFAKLEKLQPGVISCL